MKAEDLAKKFEELMNDEVFLNKLNATKDLEEAAKLFNEEGLDVSTEELVELIGVMKGEELSEEDLEPVTGGVLLETIITVGGAAIAKTWKEYCVGKNGKTTDSNQSKVQVIVDYWYKFGRKRNWWR